MNFPEKYRKFCAQVTLGAGETTHILVAGAAGIQIVVTSAKVSCLISAAQAVYVGDASGTNKIISLAASFPAFSESRTDLRLLGLSLVVGEDLVIKPAAAGPSFHCVVEGYQVL